MILFLTESAKIVGFETHKINQRVKRHWTRDLYRVCNFSIFASHSLFPAMVRHIENMAEFYNAQAREKLLVRKEASVTLLSMCLQDEPQPAAFTKCFTRLQNAGA